jgi:hydroxypyruvate reductase/glycerate 2-kinase
VAAAKPEGGIHRALMEAELSRAIATARRIIVIGGGKASAAMAAAVERELGNRLADISGIVNIPAGTELPLNAIKLNVARPAGSNEPTEAGVEGARQMLHLVAAADSSDIVIALISGGGSALLPAPVEEVSLEDKQAVTRLLMRSGADIGEMNCVRKHLSKIKGGGLAALARCPVHSLIISDVVGDRLSVIASGPTAPDPTTVADANAVLQKFDLLDEVPAVALAYIQAGAGGNKPETLKSLPTTVVNLVIACGEDALSAAGIAAESLGYQTVNFGVEESADTVKLALFLAKVMCDITFEPRAVAPPACILIGGETTVTLPPKNSSCRVPCNENSGHLRNGESRFRPAVRHDAPTRLHGVDDGSTQFPEVDVHVLHDDTGNAVAFPD